jgi:ribosomal small subunit protein bTHX
MGRGDRRSKKGKIYIKSHGNSRPNNNKLRKIKSENKQAGNQSAKSE